MNILVFIKTRSNDRKGGGVCVCFFINLLFINYEMTCTLMTMIVKSLFMEIINKDIKNTIVTVVYRPPADNIKPRKWFLKDIITKYIKKR